MQQRGYKYLGKYELPTLYCCLLQNWAKNSLAAKYDLPDLRGRTLYLDGYLFFGNADWNLLKKVTRNEFKQGKDKFFSGIFRLMEKQTKESLAASGKIISQKESSYKNWEIFFQAINYLEYPWIITLPVSDELEKLIKSSISEKKIPAEALDVFRTPFDKTPIIKQGEEAREIKNYLVKNNLVKSFNEKDILKKLNQIKEKDKSIYEKIKKHVRKYRWFGMMHFWGEPFSEKKLFSQMKNITCNKQSSKGKVNFSEISDDLKWILPITQEMVYWRNYVAEVCGMASYAIFEGSTKITKSFDLDYGMMIWMTPEELLRSLKTKKLQVTKETLQARRKSYAMIPKKESYIIVTGNKIGDYFSRGKISKVDIKIIRGNVACSGLVRGRVKKISSPSELEKIKKGDIFVASETTPDYVPALKLAGAIIADNGGITSHAAIISRELGIPCIIGTKIATKVLKDGDLVEVDAEKGVIKIFKKKT